MYLVRIVTYLRKNASDSQYDLHKIRGPTDLIKENELRSECTRDIEAKSLDGFVQLWMISRQYLVKDIHLAALTRIDLPRMSVARTFPSCSSEREDVSSEDFDYGSICIPETT